MKRRTDHERGTGVVRDLVNLLGRGVWDTHPTLPYSLHDMAGRVLVTWESAGVLTISFRDLHSQDQDARTFIRLTGWTYGTAVLLISQVATWCALAAHHRDWPTGDGQG